MSRPFTLWSRNEARVWPVWSFDFSRVWPVVWGAGGVVVGCWRGSVRRGAGVAGGAPGSSDTVKYKWSVNGDTLGSETLTGSTVTKQITLLSSGPNVLRVWGYGGIGNQSSPNELFLQTSGGITPVRWSLDEATSPSGFDTQCTATGSGPASSAFSWASPAPVPFRGPIGGSRSRTTSMRQRV